MEHEAALPEARLVGGIASGTDSGSKGDADPRSRDWPRLICAAGSRSSTSIDLVEPGFITFTARAKGEMAFGVATASAAARMVGS